MWNNAPQTICVLPRRAYDVVRQELRLSRSPPD